MTSDTDHRPLRVALAFGCIAFLAALAWAPPARAQVSDQGGFFSERAIVQAHQIINDIRQRTGMKVVVETYQAIPADRRANYTDARKAEFFEDWLVDRAKVTGADVMLLANRQPAYVKVGASQVAQRQAFPRSEYERTAGMLLEAFRAKDFDKGLIDALNHIDARVTQNLGTLAARSGSAAAAPPVAAPRSSSGGGGGVTTNAPPSGRTTTTTRGLCGGLGTGGICLIIGVVVVFLFARRMMSRRTTMGGGYGGPGYGQQGYPPNAPGPGYGGGYGQPTGGGGFGRGVLGGLLGGVLGGAAYDHLRGGHGGSAQAAPPPVDPGGGYAPPPPQEPFNPPSGFESTDVSAGGSFDDGGGRGGDFGGGDFGGGGDSGGGDTSGGSF